VPAPPVPQAVPPPAAVQAQSPPPPAAAPPAVRLALGDELALLPSPFTVPVPQPPPPVSRPVPRPAFPAPIDLSFGDGQAPSAARNLSRGTGAIDLTLGRAARDSLGAPPRDTTAQDGTIRVRGAHVGKEWLELLHEWWQRHSYYPPQAARLGQDGTVVIHVHVNRDGRVALVELESTSGSLWLDAGAQATFRGATVPPFLPSTPESEADLDITIDYILIRR
jgi:TonB family protein